MFHVVMATANIRQLRTEFPKVRAMIEREGEVVVTERGQAAYVIRPYQAPKKKRGKPEPFDYYARLIKRMPKPISAETERALDADRDDR
jgi:antitoxin (DNA-binding transcriptional repressor) of toxin-antitoxin stability system